MIVAVPRPSVPGALKVPAVKFSTMLVPPRFWSICPPVTLVPEIETAPTSEADKFWFCALASSCNRKTNVPVGAAVEVWRLASPVAAKGSASINSICEELTSVMASVIPPPKPLLLNVMEPVPSLNIW